ncbi:hypothetical protein PPACK8108_LOCUS4431 [Phakopsora pachyrhizi]|uniref:Uncharacterized protein n=1 Tax=Phakopsora pachyrhizi TaxID=170000 RepID=A0AAV0ANS2_PHAPC|nr:hypothetical protein PPACK8108_LOCUS4431 [Phakopsora pachyrhizi]
MGGLQKKYSAMVVKWFKPERFHRCAGHVLNLMAKDVLEHLGQFADSDYDFFERYISTNSAELEDKIYEGSSSFEKDLVDASSNNAWPSARFGTESIIQKCCQYPCP